MVGTISPCNTDWAWTHNTPYSEQTEEQREARKFLRQEGLQHCRDMMDIVIQQCQSHAVMEPISCEDQRIKEYTLSKTASQNNQSNLQPTTPIKTDPQEEKNENECDCSAKAGNHSLV